MCVCVCVSMRAGVYVYVHVYACVYVNVCLSCCLTATLVGHCSACFFITDMDVRDEGILIYSITSGLILVRGT